METNRSFATGSYDVYGSHDGFPDFNTINHWKVSAFSSITSNGTISMISTKESCSQIVWSITIY